MFRGFRDFFSRQLRFHSKTDYRLASVFGQLLAPSYLHEVLRFRFVLRSERRTVTVLHNIAKRRQLFQSCCFLLQLKEEQESC